MTSSVVDLMFIRYSTITTSTPSAEGDWPWFVSLRHLRVQVGQRTRSGTSWSVSLLVHVKYLTCFSFFRTSFKTSWTMLLTDITRIYLLSWWWYLESLVFSEQPRWICSESRSFKLWYSFWTNGSCFFQDYTWWYRDVAEHMTSLAVTSVRIELIKNSINTFWQCI